MQATIIGLGYVGTYLSDYLINKKSKVIIYSRKNKEPLVKGAMFYCLDLDDHNLGSNLFTDDVVYYLVPPAADNSNYDHRVANFLKNITTPPKHIIYFSTSGVYGNCNGQLIDENTTPKPQFPRHYQRLDAEEKFSVYCKNNNVALTILRVSGIYGPERLPISAVINQQPIICTKEAPMINHIHIDDLIAISYQISQLKNSTDIYNVADGNPEPMGKINCILAEIMKLPPPPIISLEQALIEASEIKKEFILSSKRLSIAKLQQKLAIKLQYPDLSSGIKAIMMATNYPSYK